MESGFYWVKWGEKAAWEPAEYIDDVGWFRIALDDKEPPPLEIGPRIPQYTDTL